MKKATIQENMNTTRGIKGILVIKSTRGMATTLITWRNSRKNS
jgi:hypothetical protein